MSVIAIVGSLCRHPSLAIVTVIGRSNRRRRTTSKAGHALEITGHAIEYLADELVREGGSVSADSPQVQAIQILMAANRKIYFECPVVPTLKERINMRRARIRRKRAWLHEHLPWHSPKAG